MTKEEILEGNKLIAKFMNLDIITDGISWFDTSYKALKKYNSSWDSLIPVVEKIESLPTKDKSRYVVDIASYTCDITQELDAEHFLGTIVSTIYPTKIEAVWNACVKFIEWYNNTKN